MQDAVRLIDQNLQEEKKTDRLLTQPDCGPPRRAAHSRAEAPACERWGRVPTGSGSAVVWLRFASRWLVRSFRSCCPRTPRSCTFTAVLSRQAQAVGLSDHCISGDAPSEPLRNGAGRLPGDPQALQQLYSWLIPVSRHAGPLSLFAPWLRSQGGQLL
jgi:hypothetical protein